MIDLALRRYPRLAIPVFAAALITTMLVALGWTGNVAAAIIVQRSDWLGKWLTDPVSIGRAIRFAFHDVFTNIEPGRSLVPFLWTMRMELIGSIFVFVMLLVCHKRRLGWILVGAAFLALVTINIVRRSESADFLSCFLVGMVFAKLRFSGFFAYGHKTTMVNAASAVVILALLAGDDIWRSQENWFPSHDIYIGYLAMLLALALFLNKFATEFLENPLSRFLGWISFPLFLIQFPIVVSVTSLLIVHLEDQAAHPLWSAVIIAISLLACIVSAMLFSPVEDFTRWVGRKITLLMRGIVQFAHAIRRPVEE